MDLISVIVPVYKVERYIKRCVKSILSQTYPKIEIILVDDGSPDNCPQICDEMAAKYNNIKVIHKANGGLSSARNAGIDASTGNYIAFIDSDDFIEKNFIKRLYELITEYDADISMVKYADVKSNRVPKKIEKMPVQVFRKEKVELAFLELKVDSVCVALYSRKIFDKHRFIVGKTSEDIPFNFEVFRHISTFVYSPEKRYYYFYNGESISNGPLDSNMFNYLYFREKIYRHYCGQNNKLEFLAEAQYARAAFGLLTRMALYGFELNINEYATKKKLKYIFDLHKKAFYEDRNTPLSRKIIAFGVTNFYFAVKWIGKLIR